MSKRDLMDTTFVLPVVVESQDRVRNIEFLTSFLLHHFDTNVLVMEEGKVPKVEYLKDKGCRYHFVPSTKKVDHRTKVLNIGFRMCDTPIVVNNDVDIFFNNQRYLTAVNKIRSGEAEVVNPYDGDVIYITQEQQKIIKRFLKKGFKKFMKQIKPEKPRYTRSMGGSIFYNKDVLIEGGMENENLVSWGKNDYERFMRFQKLGYKFCMLEGCIYHLEHDLTPRSKHQPHRVNNKKEWAKEKKMTPDELRAYVDTWEWTK